MTDTKGGEALAPKILPIAVFGADGQLGGELQRRSGTFLPTGQEIRISPFPFQEVDITDFGAVKRAFQALDTHVVINAAAYTAVDKAESEPGVAHRVNCEGAKNIALLCREKKLRYIHVSTDYVFGGPSQRLRREPFHERDEVDPCNLYGQTKREGELAVLESYPEGALIVRTASVHGMYGNNFVHTMLRLFNEREEVRVVADQIMSPTWAGWLAKVLVELANLQQTGVVHAASGGSGVSWYEFAVEIAKMATIGPSGRVATVVPIKSIDYPTPAARPSYSVLDSNTLHRLLHQSPFDWRIGLKSHLHDIGRLQAELSVGEL